MTQGRVRAPKGRKATSSGQEDIGNRVAVWQVGWDQPCLLRGSDEGSELSQSPIKGKEREVVIPDLTREFFNSPFFSRFQIQSGYYLSFPAEDA